jgi:hypothetical protein
MCAWKIAVLTNTYCYYNIIKIWTEVSWWKNQNLTLILLYYYLQKLTLNSREGYGREYRERLYGAWGIVDVEDCCSCAKFLVNFRKQFYFIKWMVC